MADSRPLHLPAGPIQDDTKSNATVPAAGNDDATAATAAAKDSSSSHPTAPAPSSGSSLTPSCPVLESGASVGASSGVTGIPSAACAGVRASRDSVHDVYGSRTPFRGEGTWPVRIDAAMRDDIEVAQWVSSACLLCSNGCGIDIGVSADGKTIAGVRGRAADRVSRGRLGPKGMHCFQVNDNRDRLTTPLVRGKDGLLHPATWDEAMQIIVDRAKAIQDQYTAHAIGFYTSGQLFLEEYHALAMVGKAGLHSLHMDGNTRLCTATAAAAMRETWGSDGQVGSYEDIDCTDCLFLVGHNVAATQTVLWMRMLDRLAGPNPPALIVLDPRRTETAKHATVHLANRAGTNLAVLLGLAHLLIRGGHVKHEFVKEHTVGYDAIEKVSATYTPEHVEVLSGVSASDLRAAAGHLARASTLLSTCLQGVYQTHQATASACAVNNLHLLLGQLGRPGAGVLQMNGQPTAQNNREAGCNGEFPGFRNYQNPAHMRDLARLWNVSESRLPTWHVPTHVSEMLEYIEEGTMKLFWVSGTNPLVSLPHLAKIRDIFKKGDAFMVVQDIFLTETAELAAVVLPAAMWGEKTGCFTNVDRTVHLSDKAIDPPGQAKSDLDIFVDFSRRMGFKDKDGGPLLPFTTSEEAFNHWRECTKGQLCDYSGLSYARLRNSAGIQWPCNEKAPDGTPRLYTDFKFMTDIDKCESYGHDLDTGTPLTREEYASVEARGRAIFKVAEYRPPPETPSKEFPFSLLTGRSVYHFHTRTKTARMPRLQAREPDAWVELHATDATNLGCRDGDMVRVYNKRGSIEVAVRITGIVPGQVFVPFHFGQWDRADQDKDKKTLDGNTSLAGRRAIEGGTHRATAANELTPSFWDPVSKQPLLKGGCVAIEKLSTAPDGPAAAATRAHAEASSPSEVELHPPHHTKNSRAPKAAVAEALTDAVHAVSKSFAHKGAAAMSHEVDSRGLGQLLPYEVHRTRELCSLVTDRLQQLHDKYTAKQKAEMGYEFGVVKSIAQVVLDEMEVQRARVPLVRGGHAAQAPPAAPASGSSSSAPSLVRRGSGSREVGGGYGGASLVGDLDSPLASCDDLHALAEALLPSQGRHSSMSPAYALVREMQATHALCAALLSHLSGLHVTGQALQDTELAGAASRSSHEIQRIIDWALAKAKTKAPQTLIVPCKMEEKK